MSVSRIARPRVLRPGLSLRYQYLRRAESTATNPTQPPQGFSFSKPFRRTWLWSSAALGVGIMGGSFVVHTIAPPELPDAGSREDGILMADLNKRIDEDFKVKTLRGKCLGVAKALKGDQSGWVEVVQPPVELDETTQHAKTMRSQLAGAKGLGVERLFWDRGEKKLVAVVWFGGSLCGWPGVTHGGAIATQLAEKLSVASALGNDTESSVRVAATPQRLPGLGNHAKMLAPADTPPEPAQLSLNYRKPTVANCFYVIRVAPALPLDNEDHSAKEVSGGHDWEATVETMDAKTCVTARARFAPNSALQRAEDKVASGVRNTYSDFKNWMWPSRQENSQLG